MKRGKASKIMGVDPKTITDWANRPEFEPYLSPGALGTDGASQRTYNESDILVLNTIRVERNERNAAWADIAGILESGERNRDLPPTALTVDTSAPIAQYGRIQAYEARIEWLEEQVDDMRERHEQEVAHLRGENDRILGEWRGEVGELREEIGMLKAMLKIEQGKNDE
jgi:DNA-binding transcriptional MerR regulator